MTTRIFCIAIIFLGISINPLSAQESTNFDPAAATYLWPTEASSYLSSTFGETRSAHFHAALDIKTWGRRGYDVYATRDGIVDRIAIGPRGYGKAIYLKHNDGSYSVYAHLLSFNKQLQQLADSARFANDYQFELEKFLGWKNIEVEQGDLIGYSGASGIGPPHLHFELRTPNHRPFNPLLTNLSVTDNIPPQIRDISVEPLSPQSSIEGQNDIYTKRARLNNGTYSFGTITVNGPVGLGLNVFDQSNNVNNSYAVYELNLRVNNEHFFSSRVDSFSYNETSQMFIDRVYPILKNTDKGFQRLYIADGNTLPFYQTNTQNGVIDLPAGTHQARITARDYYGNTSTASLTIEVPKQESPKKYPQYTNNQKPKIVSPDLWNWFDNWVTIPHNQYEYATLGLADSADVIHHSNGVALNTENKDPLFINTTSTGPLHFYRVNPSQKTFISSTAENHFAVFPKHTFFDTVSVSMAVKKSQKDAITVDILPDSYPIAEEFKFYISRDSTLQDTTNLSFYNFDQEKEEWDLIPTRFTNDYMIAKTENSGHFSLKEDALPPLVTNPSLHQRRDDKWVIFIDATDNLSGIDFSRSTISVNNRKGIAEFEPEDDRFVYYHPNFVPADSLKIKITAYDKMGNKTQQTWKLEN